MMRDTMQCLAIMVMVACLASTAQGSLWCYHCVSTQPGCGTPFNWVFHWTKICPEPDDVCVKIIEQKEDTTVITRDCLSSLKAERTDIPADHYEGCRPAAKDVHLANYVNTSIKEHDVYRNYYDSTTWCFCFLDHWCNAGPLNTPQLPLILLSSSIFYISKLLW